MGAVSTNGIGKRVSRKPRCPGCRRALVRRFGEHSAIFLRRKTCSDTSCGVLEAALKCFPLPAEIINHYPPEGRFREIPPPRRPVDQGLRFIGCEQGAWLSLE